ncbi:MAG: mannonate dehydratase [Terriglobia bacterium]
MKIDSQNGCIKLALMLRPDEVSRIKLAAQLGVNNVIANVMEELDKVPRTQYLDVLAKFQGQCKALGLTIAGVESHPVSAEKIKLGLPGRDAEIENYCAAIEALGKLGIPMVCYNFMAGIGWCRTSVSVRGRGGAFTSEFDLAAAERQGPTEWGEVSEQKIWENLEYFLRAVIPVAEKAGVRMALHPDDPPISPLRGIGRILTSAANFRRMLKVAPSPASGITFCQANFKLMGEDLKELVCEWCGEKKIFFVHFRDVKGTAENFVETFHDNGPTDMAGMMQVYYDAGFAGPMRPDHAPTLEGESNENPGYEILGKIFAIGYMKGIMVRAGIPYA